MEVAVHPADDGKLVIDESPSGATSTLKILAGVFAVIIVVCLIVIGLSLFSGGDETDGAGADDREVRDAVLSQADQFVRRVNTYGPADLDEGDALPGYAERVREVITSKFSVSFDDNLTLAEQSVSQAGYARAADIYAVGLESAEGDKATALVAGVINGSYPDSSAQAEEGDRVEYEPQPFRFQVELVRSEGEWLVDDFSPLTGEIINPEDLIGTEAPSTEPDAQPSDKPTSKQSKAPGRTPSTEGSGS